MLNGLPPDTVLKSLTFKSAASHSTRISSVQGVLSNGRVSPLFEKKDIDYVNIRTLEIIGDDGSQRPVRAVRGRDDHFN